MDVIPILKDSYWEHAYPDMQINTARAAVDEAAILRKHDALIVAMAAGFGALADDLAQEGRMALLRAANTWRGENGAALWTYARRFVFAAMLRHKTLCCGMPGPLDDAHEVAAPDSDIEAAAIVHECLEALSKEERRVVQLVLEGHNFDAISRAMGRSGGAYAHRIFRAATETIRGRLS